LLGFGLGGQNSSLFFRDHIVVTPVQADAAPLAVTNLCAG
jgi:hypothetical protein